jgi:aconitase A
MSITRCRSAERNGLTGISKLPFSMKVLLENLLALRGRPLGLPRPTSKAIVAWLTDKGTAGKEIGFRPARVLMQDFTGVPAVVDLAAMRDGVVALGGDPKKINPLVPSISSSTIRSSSTSSARPGRSRRTSSSNMSAMASATAS